MRFVDKPVLIDNGSVYGTIDKEVSPGRFQIRIAPYLFVQRDLSDISFVGWQIVITGSEAMCGGAARIYSKRVWFNREVAQAECDKCLETCIQKGTILPYERNVAAKPEARLREIEIICS